MTRELRAAGVLLFRGDPPGEFLLLRHVDRWDIPKGHAEEGESDLDCGLRELFEETGISREDIEVDPDFRFSIQYPVCSSRTGGDWWPKTVVVFLGRLKRDVPLRLTEHVGSQWWTWRPPHRIQEQTIDPLLAAVAEHLDAPSRGAGRTTG
jgi:8-oxo-dGTP pyrophosphatase MutT (NUDIX family)